jgi:hypothetical protein
MLGNPGPVTSFLLNAVDVHFSGIAAYSAASLIDVRGITIFVHIPGTFVLPKVVA